MRNRGLDLGDAEFGIVQGRDIDTTDGMGMWMGTENKMPDYVNVGVERNRMGDDA